MVCGKISPQYEQVGLRSNLYSPFGRPLSLFSSRKRVREDSNFKLSTEAFKRAIREERIARLLLFVRPIIDHPIKRAKFSRSNLERAKIAPLNVPARTVF